MESKYVPYDSIDALVADSSHIFVGEYVRNETVKGVTAWTHDIFRVTEMLKAVAPWNAPEFPIMSPDDLFIEKKAGERYLVFVLMTDTGVYPVPLMNAIAIFPLEPDQTIRIDNMQTETSYQFRFLDIAFSADPVRLTKESPEIRSTPPYFVDALSLSDTDASGLIDLADVVVTARLRIIDHREDGISLCELNVVDILKNSDKAYQAPRTIVVPIVPNEEVRYLLLFRVVTSDRTLFLISPNAIVPESQEDVWDKLMSELE